MNPTWRLLLSMIVLVAVGIVAFQFTDKLRDNDFTLALAESTGYLGIYAAALASGLSAVIPIPPGVLAPLFETTGLSFTLIIVFLSLGTLTADLFGFYLGNFNSTYIKTKAPRIYSWFKELYDKKPHLVLPMVFAYIAFVPLPNELVVITLGALGYAARSLMLPLFFGSILHHTIVALGARSIFSTLF